MQKGSHIWDCARQSYAFAQKEAGHSELVNDPIGVGTTLHVQAYTLSHSAYFLGEGFGSFFFSCFFRGRVELTFVVVSCTV